MPSEPLLFSHYAVLRRAEGAPWELGHGGMGITYKAHDTKLGIDVVLKVIRPELLNDVSTRQRFFREARAAAKIRHSNVAAVIQLHDDEPIFYTMEYVDGQPLSEMLRTRGTLSPAEALDFVDQVAAALGALGREHIVHRDLKPGNLMAVADDERPFGFLIKVIDFGLAKGVVVEGQNMESMLGDAVSQSGTFSGTMPYASPEQCALSLDIDGRSDLYSLGIVLWEMLAGNRPFVGSSGQLIAMHQYRDPPWDQLAGMPHEVIQILRRLLAKSPADRYQTARELRDVIAACRALLPATSSARPVQSGSPSSESEATIQEAAPETVRLGTTLSQRYRLGQEIGSGDGGVLFRGADNLDNDSPVAAKVIPAQRFADPRFVTVLEGDLAAQRSIPYPLTLKPLTGLLRAGSGAYFVREWAEGFSLLELLRTRGALTAPEVRQLLVELPSAIDFAANLKLAAPLLQKIFVTPPANRPSSPSVDWPSLRSESVSKWPEFTLRWNAISFAPAPDTIGDRDGITVPGRVIDSQTDDAVVSLARLIYQLLGGLPRRVTPLPALSDSANAILQRALGHGGGTSAFGSAEQFWKEIFPPLPRPSQPGVGSPAATPVALEPAAPMPPLVAVPPAPKFLPAPAATEPKPSGKRSNLTRVAAIAVAALVVLGAGAYYAFFRELPYSATDLDSCLTAAERHPQRTKVAAAIAQNFVAMTRQNLMPTDPQMARIRSLAERGNAGAQLILGRVYFRGLGTPKDDAKAIEWYRKSAEQGLAEGQVGLGLMHQLGRGTPVNNAEAVRLMRLAANAGSPGGEAALGRMYNDGAGIPKDETEAVKWFQKSADQGDPYGMMLLGLNLANGRGIAKNEAEAVRLYRAAIDKGFIPANAYLGNMYMEGRGVRKDEREAVKCFRTVAELKDVTNQFDVGYACQRLGQSYALGRGVARDDDAAFKWFQAGADLGDVNAQLDLARMYSSGRGVARDDTAAVKWYRVAADKGYPLAQYMLANQYADGRGVTKDDVEAVRLYRLAIEKGEIIAYAGLGNMFLNGRGVARNEIEAVKCFRRVADAEGLSYQGFGLSLALENLGLAYLFGRGVAKDPPQGVQYFRKGADAGYASCQTQLGNCYANGRGVEKNDAEAVNWYRKAAEQGFANAELNLGFCYENGKGIPVDLAEGAKWYRRAADQGQSTAQSNLANLYFSGRGVPKNDGEGYKWAKKSADQGDPHGQRMLGYALEKGFGVPRDMTEAISWYRKSASGGDAQAWYSLGQIYLYGRGVEKSESESADCFLSGANLGNSACQFAYGQACMTGRGVQKNEAAGLKWYREAADQGSPAGCFEIGACYELGRGVRKDDVEALKWYQKAADLKFEPAQKAIENLKQARARLENPIKTSTSN